ncbi:MAG: hypothetical protein WC792_04495 [Candidatus Micrarchaeia archaeon]
MKKTINVLVVGVPTAGLEVQAWRRLATFKIQKKKPKVSTSKLFESFKRGSTNQLRKRVAKAIEESGELLRRDITAHVEDAGEIIPEQFAKRFEGKYGLDENDMLGLSEEFAALCEGKDLVVLLGGDHAGGLLLYALEGNVARFDEHSDSCATPLTCSPGVLRNNYVCTAIRLGLKTEKEIQGVGVREGEQTYELASHATNADIFDIDLDVIAPKYGIATRHSKGNLSPDALVGAIRANCPRVVGFFEAVPEHDASGADTGKVDEKTQTLIEQLAIEAAINCKKR